MPDTEKTYTVAELRKIIDNAEKVCESFGVSPDETPWYVGFVSTEPPSDAAIERGRQLAKEHGWL